MECNETHCPICKPQRIVRLETPIKTINGLPTTSDAWQVKVKTDGLQYLGEGISRRVYALNDDYVIKIGDQCDNETLNWNCATENERRFLAPIIASGEGWNIMKRATKIGRDFPKFMKPYDWSKEEHKQKLSLRNVEQVFRKRLIGLDLYDMHAGNFGLVDGKLKLIDYAG